MKHPHPYIVLAPGMPTNSTGQHLVVHIKEWLAVALGEKDTYTFFQEHPDYEHAAAERDRLNHRPGVSLARPLTEASKEVSA